MGLRAGLATYPYAANRPTAFVDPKGLMTCGWSGPIWICQQQQADPPGPGSLVPPELDPNRQQRPKTFPEVRDPDQPVPAA